MNQNKYIQSLKNVIFSKLIHLGMVKTGIFTLKNGTHSNIYMDLRQLVNYPQFFPYLTNLLYLEHPGLLDILCQPGAKLIPIPLGGLPLGFHLSTAHGIPLLMIRDKAKDHGTKRLIEGVIQNGDRYILVEDVITSGTSIIQALDNISSHLAPGSLTPDTPDIPAIICICNRSNVSTLRDIPVFSIFTLAELEDYITNTITNTNTNAILNETVYFKYGTAFSNKLYQLALIKRSNIILSCDFMKNREILDCLRLIGPSVIAVKLHLDTLDTYEYCYGRFLAELKLLKAEHQFLVIEDAKYADIDAIMIEKVNHSQLELTTAADAFTMHAVAGLSILEGDKLEIPAIVVAEMSSANNMITHEYTQKIVDSIHLSSQGDNNSKLMLGGVVCQSQLPRMIEPFEMATMSPGVNLEVIGDGHNQQYKIPSLAEGQRVGMFWIVGRGITVFRNNNEKLKEVMNTYQSRGWDYFIKY